MLSSSMPSTRSTSRTAFAVCGASGSVAVRRVVHFGEVDQREMRTLGGRLSAARRSRRSRVVRSTPCRRTSSSTTDGCRRSPPRCPARSTLPLFTPLRSAVTQIGSPEYQLLSVTVAGEFEPVPLAPRGIVERVADDAVIPGVHAGDQRVVVRERLRRKRRDDRLRANAARSRCRGMPEAEVIDVVGAEGVERHHDHVWMRSSRRRARGAQDGVQASASERAPMSGRTTCRIVHRLQTAVRMLASRSAARFSVSYFLQKAKRTSDLPEAAVGVEARARHRRDADLLAHPLRERDVVLVAQCRRSRRARSTRPRAA